MLSSKYRVKRGENEKCAINRRIFRGSSVSIGVTKSLKNNNPPKITVVISKKTIKTAVDRNRLKRRVYNIVSEHIKHIHAGIYMVYIKKEVKNTTYKELKKDISNVLKETQQ